MSILQSLPVFRGCGDLRALRCYAHAWRRPLHTGLKVCVVKKNHRKTVARTTGILLYFSVKPAPRMAHKKMAKTFKKPVLFENSFCNKNLTGGKIFINCLYLLSTSTRPGRRGFRLRRLCLPELPCSLCSVCLQLPFLRCRQGAPDA